MFLFGPGSAAGACSLLRLPHRGSQRSNFYPPAALSLQAEGFRLGVAGQLFPLHHVGHQFSGSVRAPADVAPKHIWVLNLS
jgi:hypothetical protein